LRGGRPQVKEALETIDEIGDADRYLIPFRDREKNFKTGIKHKDRPVEEIVREKAEDDKT